MRALAEGPKGLAPPFLKGGWGGISLLLGLLACGRPTGDAPPEAGMEPAAKPPRTVVTEVATVHLLRDTLELTAEVAPWAAVTVAAEATGRVVELPVELGDEVQAGVVLARVDDAAARARLEQADAEVARTAATLDQAERALERGRQLAATRDISDDELDRLVSDHDRARAQIVADQAQVTLRRQSLDDTVVRAPFAGVVSDRMVELGTWTSAGSPLVRVVDRRRVKVRGSASQRDRARLRPGMTARVQTLALPGEVFEGRVRLLGQEADERTGGYRVEVAVEQPLSPSGQRLLPGMRGTLVIELGSREGLTIPRSALFQGSEGEGVFAVRGSALDRPGAGGAARWVQPETGVLTEGFVEILSGIEAGDRVVVLGQHMLRDGDAVLVEVAEAPQ